MRYDWNDAVGCPEFSQEFYAEIDRRFFSSAREFMPWRALPFDALIDFGALKYQDVLEIGVGNGSHAALLASNARSFTGIDLTDYAVTSTSARLAQAGLPANILRMDAERMRFPDDSFDFVWSWGVIHHSSDTSQVLREIARVLRPGGRAVTMVYHRSLWGYYFLGAFAHGIVRRGFRASKSLHEVVQSETDGAIARYYSRKDWRLLASRFLDVNSIKIFGSKLELIPLPAGEFKRGLARALPNPVGRFFTNTCCLGTFLVSEMHARR